MRRFDLVLFDFDGTLADSLDGIACAMVESFRRLGLAAPGRERVAKVVGLPLEGCARALSPELGETDVAAWVASYREIYHSIWRSMTRLYDGMSQVLHELKGCGVPMAVVSNKGHDQLQAAVDCIGLSHLVELAVGRTPGAPVKPDAALFHARVRPSYPSVEPGRVLMVGDAIPDIDFARNIGAASCYASYGYGDRAACLQRCPNFEAAHPSDIVSVVLG